MIPLSVSLANTSHQPENCRDWVESRLGFREPEERDTEMINTETLPAHKRLEILLP